MRRADIAYQTRQCVSRAGRVVGFDRRVPGESSTCTYTHKYTHMHNTYIYIYTYMHTYIHTYIHTHIHTYVHSYIHTYVGRGNVVGIATCYRLGCPGIESRPERNVPSPPRPALGPPSLLHTWYRVTFQGVKRAGSGLDYLLPSSPEITEVHAYKPIILTHYF
jgi:hypothetical protein